MNRTRSLCRLLLSVCLVIAPVDAFAQSTVVTLSNHAQLFLDDYLVAHTRDLRREVKQPAKHAANPLIKQDLPWEQRMIEIYGTVLYDAARNQYRCWYLASGKQDGVFDTPEGPITAEYYQCYAESADGVHWTKPLVRTKSFDGHERHNIVIPGGHGFSVLATPDDPNPQRKFKGGGGPTFGFSADGIEWSLHNWRDAVGKNDTGTSIVRWKGEYLAYVRYQIRDPHWPAVMRGVGISASADFMTWSPKQLVFQTDEHDGYPWTQPYGISVTPYGDQLIGLLWMLKLDQSENNNTHGDMDVQLVVSRDGRTWQRVADRQAFLSPTLDSWDRGAVFPGTSLLFNDDRVLVYYTGKSSRHGTPGTLGIGVATLPADRFVCLRPQQIPGVGVLTTRLFQFSGETLLVNADVRPQDLLVAVLDERGNVVDGFSEDQCQLTVHDPLRYRVSWREKTLGDVPQGKAIALRMTLKRGELFAFQVIH